MNSKVLWVIIGCFAVATGILGYKAFDLSERNVQVNDEKAEVESERLAFQNDLYEMRFQYDSLQTNNSEVSAEMEAQKQQLNDLIKKSKDKDWSIHKLKKEAETLRTIMKGYIVTIDSLNQYNQELLAVNADMQSRVSNVTEENEDLKKRQENMEEIISTGQVLQTSTISAEAVRLRNNGKQSETTRASKTEYIKSCMTIMRNPIAKSGGKTLYLQVIDPDGKVLPNTDGGSMTLSGNTQGYSVQRSIDYQNDETDVCIFYTVQEQIKKGDYTLLVFEGGAKIGETKLILK